MYIAPAAGGGAADGAPLRLRRVCHQVFTGSSPSATEPGLRTYLADLVQPHGLALREDLLASGAGQSYGEMAHVLISAAVPPDEPVDLLVLAFAVPDVTPERATASYLSHVCPGEPMAFAICDQGNLTPFSGLRIAKEYGEGGGCQRVALLIAEQAVLHHEPPCPVSLPARHAAVCLLFDTTGPARLGAVRQHPGVAPAQAADVLAAEAAGLARAPTATTLIIGNGLASAAGSPDVTGLGEVRIAAPGQPSTGVWGELAAVLPGWTAAGGQVLLADYDPALGYLGVAALTVPAPPPARAARPPARQPRAVR